MVNSILCFFPILLSSFIITDSAFFDGILFEIAHEVNRHRADDMELAQGYAALLKEFGEMLGLLQRDPEAFLKGGVGDDNDAEIDQLIAERNQARADKNWAESDRIRDELQSRGIVLEDGAGGTTWRRE